MYDNGTERGQDIVYKQFGGLGEEQPSFMSNIRYFIDYQFRWMYWRYFMWNFAGKQNDLQGFGNAGSGAATVLSRGQPATCARGKGKTQAPPMR